MIQRLLQTKLFLPSVFFTVLLLNGAPPCYATDGSDRYLYQQQAAGKNSSHSCAATFDDILNGGEGDFGIVIRSLKTINVNYLLDDYDNSLGSDRRKKVMELEDLLAEVENNKREIYCKIELAIYLADDYSEDPVYGDLLSAAFEELDAAYASAQRSYAGEDFARAGFAFDLIAPYRDALRLSRSLAAEPTNSTEKAAVSDLADDSMGVSEQAGSDRAGPIRLAAMTAGRFIPRAADEGPGPIARAARVGPITAAADLMNNPANTPAEELNSMSQGPTSQP